MKNIKFQGIELIEFIYCYLNETLRTANELQLYIMRSDSFMENQLKNSSNIRLIIMKNFWNSEKIGVAYYLYFEPDRIPKDLDNKIKNDTWTDADFQDSFMTRFQETLCFNCNWRGPTLCLDLDCYLGNYKLYQEKIRKNILKPCPKCGDSLRQAVVKIF